MAAIEILRPGMRAGSLAPWRQVDWWETIASTPHYTGKIILIRQNDRGTGNPVMDDPAASKMAAMLVRHCCVCS